jgi:hypothetical protein
MTAPVYDFTGDQALEQGSRWQRTINYKTADGVVIDITGWTARMQIRKSVTSSTVLLELTTENDRIVIDGAAGEITLDLSATETASITWKSGVYDLELIPDAASAFRFIQGEIEVSPEVTR